MFFVSFVVKDRGCIISDMPPDPTRFPWQPFETLRVIQEMRKPRTRLTVATMNSRRDSSLSQTLCASEPLCLCVKIEAISTTSRSNPAIFIAATLRRWRVIQEMRRALRQAQGNALGIGPSGAEQFPALGGALGLRLIKHGLL